MPSILIADRDQTERTGIRWFIQSNRLNFETIGEAAQWDEMIEYINSYQPDVVCLELEMVPSHKMTEITMLLRQYVKTVICLTAEAVFERAVQAIEFHGISLLIKPLSHEQLKKSLFQASQSSLDKFRQNEALESSAGQISYPALFKAQPLEQNAYSMMILRPDKKEHMPILSHWLEQYTIPYPVQYFTLSKDVVCVLQIPKQNESIILQQEGQRILQRWSSEYPNRRLNIAIHPASVSAASLNEMYLKTVNLFKLSFFKGMQQLFWADRDVSFYSIDPFLTPEEQREWMALLEEGSKQGIKNWLYENFTNFKAPYPEPELLRVRFTSILAQLRRFMKTYYLDQNHELEDYYHNIFNTVLFDPVLFKIVQEVILFVFALIDGAERQKEKAATDVIERGLRFMEQNYHIHQLSLKDIAEYVGLSPSYYSHLMTQSKGRSFRSILTDIRLRKARQLLVETTLTIQEITDQIGFTDANYFSRVFKKAAGKSPRAYRQQEKSKKSKEK
ncbi:YesN/AraC family two-component response regulator [Scopulibacillus daqui]|uniref:YesN/AraC family two-component response regulator n=1 Tax=Scopulibacillus daqui TaxID=1469162 RepID=A0ABS2Q1Y9_9BACL|nr:helix-turn-helix domain-containing protein [Scopulibacillus daqui]MBM7646302.1 YesN/AraC family two-component response regulator [Scopulibacillus daqui]